MSTLLTKVKAVQTRAQELRLVQLADQNAAAVALRRQRLEALRDDVARSQAFIAAATVAGLPLPAEDPTPQIVDAALDAVRALASAIGEDATALIEGNSFEHARQSLRGAADVLKSRAAAIWSEHTQPQEIETRLEIVKALQAAVKIGTPRRQRLGTLINLLNEMRTLANDPAPAAAAILSWGTIREQYDHLWAEVAGDQGIGTKALAFIQAASSHVGAPLSDFDDEVREELTALHLISSFRVALNR